MKLVNIIFVGLFFFGCGENNSQNYNEDSYRDEYRNDPQAQSVYESEEEYIQDR